MLYFLLIVIEEDFSLGGKEEFDLLVIGDCNRNFEELVLNKVNMFD